MNKLELKEDEVLLVASRGLEEHHGLWLWSLDDVSWQGRQVGKAQQLCALAGHPTLSVVYGAAAAGQGGMLHAWRIDKAGEAELCETSSQGTEPCHLAVDPSGRLLVATNYASSTLALQRLNNHGAFVGPVSLLKLTGSGPDAQRQDDAHPHQALFIADRLVVVDLGADLIREFALDFDRDAADILSTFRTTKMPHGTGPRHAVVLPDGRLAVSGELGESLLVGHLDAPPESWISVRSTGLVGPAKSRWDRNYPGDIRLSHDRRYVYLANRSHDSVATFNIGGPIPVLVGEEGAGGHWPQHLLALPHHVLAANWDSSSVTMLPLQGDIPQAAEPLFDCQDAAWLHLHRLA